MWYTGTGGFLVFSPRTQEFRREIGGFFLKYLGHSLASQTDDENPLLFRRIYAGWVEREHNT